jgi:hypothetical protein
MPITTKTASSNSAYGEMYLIQYYVIKFVSDLWQVGVFFRGTLVSSTNRTNCHDITEILLKVALNTITLTPLPLILLYCYLLRCICTINSYTRIVNRLPCQLCSWNCCFIFIIYKPQCLPQFHISLYPCCNSIKKYIDDHWRCNSKNYYGILASIVFIDRRLDSLSNQIQKQK